MFSITKDYSFTKLLADNLRKRYERNRRTDKDLIHVSDIISSGCVRKQYYDRKFPDQNIISDDSVYAFVRGESSERVITELADIGASQVTVRSENGIIGRPDILRKGPDLTPSDFLVVELKDSASIGAPRLEPSDFTFKGYLHQLLYYLVLTDIANGILCIKYSTPELTWVKRTSEGDFYLKAFNARSPGIESWSVFLSLDDPLRAEINEEMDQKRSIFLEALKTTQVEILPRLTGFSKKLKCKRCPHMDRCWGSDGESVEAMKAAGELSIIDRIPEVYA